MCKWTKCINKESGGISKNEDHGKALVAAPSQRLHAARCQRLNAQQGPWLAPMHLCYKYLHVGHVVSTRLVFHSTFTLHTHSHSLSFSYAHSTLDHHTNKIPPVKTVRFASTHEHAAACQTGRLTRARQKRSGKFRGIKTRQTAQLSDPEGAVNELGSLVAPWRRTVILFHFCSASFYNFVQTGTNFGSDVRYWRHVTLMWETTRQRKADAFIRHICDRHMRHASCTYATDIWDMPHAHMRQTYETCLMHICDWHMRHASCT